jgi:hypothetical protein
MSSSSDRSWERDLLGPGVLQSGYHIPVYVVPGGYDRALVDEDKDRCILRDIAAYRATAFHISHNRPLGCEGLTTIAGS